MLVDCLHHCRFPRRHLGQRNLARQSLWQGSGWRVYSTCLKRCSSVDRISLLLQSLQMEQRCQIYRLLLEHCCYQRDLHHLRLHLYSHQKVMLPKSEQHFQKGHLQEVCSRQMWKCYLLHYFRTRICYLLQVCCQRDYLLWQVADRKVLHPMKEGQVALNQINSSFLKLVGLHPMVFWHSLILWWARIWGPPLVAFIEALVLVQKPSLS